MDTLPELDHWQEWQRRCALSLLDAEGQTCLRESIAARFCRALRRYCDHMGLRASAFQAPQTADCAHLFETHCALHQRAEGKSYKHWLLARGDHDIDSVQSGVALLARMVVREWLRREHKPHADVSLDEVPLGASEPLSVLLPDRLQESGYPSDLNTWMESRMPEWIFGLHPVERKVLLIRQAGRDLYDPVALRQHGVGKSSLYNHQRVLFTKLAGQVRDAYPDIRPALGTKIVLEILDRLGEKLT